MAHTHNTHKQGRAGGEKRGNKYDRVARLSKLSVANGSAPIVPVAVPQRVRRNGAWLIEDRPLPFRTVNECVHCIAAGKSPEDAAIYCDPDPEARNEIAYRAEQDRIDPEGGYTMNNLQLSCSACNKRRSDNPDWIPGT